MKDLKVRTITAVCLVAVVIPIVFFGKITIDIFALILCVLASYELEHMFKGEEKWSFYGISDIVLSALSFISLLLIYKYNNYKYILILIFSIFLIEGLLMIFTKGSDINTLGRSLISIFYPSLGFASLAIVRNVETSMYREGLWLLVYVVLICFMTDNFAYVFGSKYGKHKLAPLISPHKSWEGSIAGTVFAAVFPPIFCAFTGVSEFLFPSLSPMWAVICTIPLSIFLSFIDEIGDLFASKLKRAYGLKDYSKLLPGHGGILDRFDSYIFVSLALLLYILLFL